MSEEGFSGRFNARGRVPRRWHGCGAGGTAEKQDRRRGPFDLGGGLWYENQRGGLKGFPVLTDHFAVPAGAVL